MNTSFFGELLQTISERGRALIDRTRDRRGDAAARSQVWSSCARSCCPGAAKPRASRSRARSSRLRRADDRPAHRVLRGAGDAVRRGPRADRRGGGCLDARRHRRGGGRTASRRRAAPAGAVPPAQSRARRHRGAGLDARGPDGRDGAARRPRRRSTRISCICSRRGSTAASWCCATSTGRRPRSFWKRSSATRRCIRSSDWDDLRRRIDPPDRRCYAFFHPALNDEPLIFVEVAFTDGIPRAIAPILGKDGDTLAPESREHGGVLFDLELPARARRRVASAAS